MAITPKESTTKYVSNDFSILNQYADGLIARDRSYSLYRNGEVWLLRAKIFVLVCLGLLILGFLATLIFEKSVFKNSEHSVSINGDTQSLPSTAKNSDVEVRIVKVPDPSLSRVIEKQVIVEVPKYVPVEIPSSVGLVNNFTVFRFVKIDNEFVKNVVTGLKFSASDKPFPDRQYCYLESKNTQAGVGHTLEIGEISGYDDVVWNISSTAAEAVKIPLNMVKKLKEKCSFMSNADGVAAIPVVPDQPSEPSTSVYTGTGFAVNTLGHIVTNEHVVSDCSKITISASNKTYRAELVVKDRSADLAILKSHPKFTRKSYAFASQVRTGQDAVVFGYPMSQDLGTNVKVTSGLISSLTGPDGQPSWMQFTAPIQPGNSGGPVVNDRNEIIGVSTAGIAPDKASNVFFAIRGATVQSFLGKHRIPFKRAAQETILMGIPDMVEVAEKQTFLIICHAKN